MGTINTPAGTVEVARMMRDTVSAVEAVAALAEEVAIARGILEMVAKEPEEASWRMRLGAEARSWLLKTKA